MVNFYTKYNLKPIINVAGTMTSIGASIINSSSLKSVKEIYDKFIYIDELQKLASKIISKRLKTQAAMVTASSSSGLTESIAAIYSRNDLKKIFSLPKMVGKKNVLIQQGHLVNYGGEVNQAIRLAGASILKTGKKNVCSALDLQRTINSNKNKILCALYVLSHHCDEYQSLDYKNFYNICSKANIPVILDAASESNMKNLSQFADLTIFSAHKFMGGLTAGIIAGKKELIRGVHLQNLGIGRGFKAGKESIFSAIFAIEDWYRRDHKKINQKFMNTVKNWKKYLDKYSNIIKCEIIPDPTGNPIQRLRIIPLTFINAPSLALALESQKPAIVVRDDLLHQGFFELDPCNLHPGQESKVMIGFDKIFQKKQKFKKINLSSYKKIKKTRCINWI